MSTFKNTTINDTGYLALPAGNITQRPGYTVVTYTSGSGNWSVPTGVTSVEVLVVAGGGSGGSGSGNTTGTAGGGGAGGVVFNGSYATTPGASIAYSVGAGGAAVTSSGTSLVGLVGNNSTFGTITAYGGGYGGKDSTPGGNGGCGGGGPSGIGTRATGTAGQGFDGGITSYLANLAATGYGSGGGGGAGGQGGDGVTIQGGAGGPGRAYSITGTLTWYGGGGGAGGSRIPTNNPGAGGLGGGGAGGAWTVNGTAGTNGTGGGGGASGSNDGNTIISGKGGDGIVIIAYTTPTSVSTGQTRYNTTIGQLEYWNGTKWLPATPDMPSWYTAPGSVVGTVYSVGRNVDVTVRATTANGGVTYTLVEGLPGCSINSTTGRITGTLTATSTIQNADITWPFSVKATNTLDSSYSIAEFKVTAKTEQVATFSYTGADQFWQVPVGVTAFKAKLWGAGGGCQENDASGNGGGSGGFTTGTVALTSVNTGIRIMVGQGGQSGQSLNNGGGGAGGGLTGLFTDASAYLAISDTDRSRAILIAGGGGGESDQNNEFGGPGGGTSGGNSAAYSGAQGSTGGTQSAPGGPLSPTSSTMRGRDCAPPSSGGGTLTNVYGFGGRSYAGSSEVPNGGGGGGYYGGGSQTGQTYISGGGGSGYVGGATGASVTNGNTYIGQGAGVPAANAISDSDYPGSSIGYGGRQGVVQGQSGFNGYLVIRY